MNKIKSILDSLFSALCIVGWIAIAIKIMTTYNGENAITKFFWTLLITVSAGIIGGMALHLYSLLKNGTLKHSFIYNFFGTLNIMAGSLGMAFHSASGQPAPYLAVACFAVGIIMYRNIYTRDKRITSN